jgi:hypothetical protein
LDVIAITDHDTSNPEHVVGDKNTPYEMARRAAEQNRVLLVSASEITRFQRPDRVGHFNALFVDDVNLLVGKDYFESVTAAVDQGAFIFLNHPSESWNSHLWKEEFQRLEANGLIHGVEVVNGGRYYENAQEWCVEKGLVPVATSDLHAPSHYTHGYNPAGHRPMTLVFAKERTLEGVKEALFAGRTAAYSEHSIYGSSEVLEPLFYASMEVLTKEVTLTGTGSTMVEIRNRTDFDLSLVPQDRAEAGWIPISGDQDLQVTGGVVIPARRVARVSIRNTGEETKSGTFRVELPYTVENLVVAPGIGLEVSIPLTVKVVPEGSSPSLG